MCSLLILIFVQHFSSLAYFISFWKFHVPNQPNLYRVKIPKLKVQIMHRMWWIDSRLFFKRMTFFWFYNNIMDRNLIFNWNILWKWWRKERKESTSSRANRKIIFCIQTTHAYIYKNITYIVRDVNRYYSRYAIWWASSSISCEDGSESNVGDSNALMQSVN